MADASAATIRAGPADFQGEKTDLSAEWYSFVQRSASYQIGIS